MDPLTLMTILSGAGSLGGLFFRDNQSDMMMKKLNQFFNPHNISADADTFYKRMLMSPAFSSAKRNVLGSSNAAASSVAARLGASGLNQTGIGAITGGIGSNLAGFKMGDLYSAANAQAWQQAMELARGRASSLGSFGRDRNIPADIYSAFLGSLGPLALAYGARGKKTNSMSSPNAGWFGNLNTVPGYPS